MRELCWLITNKCNEKCKFCHFFNDMYKENNYYQNRIILSNLIRCGCSHITWSGGEAFLRDDIETLVKEAKFDGIMNTVITNGQSHNIVSQDIFKYLDEIAISLDAILPQTNIALGRNNDHFDNVRIMVDKARKINPNIKLRINTVVMSGNTDEIMLIGQYIKENNISTWRISKFQPLRCNALKNKHIFEIEDAKYELILDNCSKENFNCHIETRYKNDFEEKYIMIVPNGDIIVTQDNQDITLGNANNYRNVFEIING